MDVETDQPNPPPNEFLSSGDHLLDPLERVTEVELRSAFMVDRHTGRLYRREQVSR